MLYHVPSYARARKVFKLVRIHLLICSKRKKWVIKMSKVDTVKERIPLIELKGITKAFPGVVANDDIHLTLYEGEIHALVGETELVRPRL